MMNWGIVLKINNLRSNFQRCQMVEEKASSILKLGEMCRKMETEEEKVLPFGVVPPTPRTEEEEEKTQDPKLNEIVSDYEVFF